MKNCPDFVKTSMMTYFNNAADDLAQTLLNLEQGRYSHLRGTTMKTSSSLNYVQFVLLPVLTAVFDHLAANEFGSDLLRACPLVFLLYERVPVGSPHYFSLKGS